MTRRWRVTSAWRALLRLARRDVRQHPGRALLVILLIGAPVAGLIAAAILQTTVTPTADQRARQTLGSADLAVYALDATGDQDAVVKRLPADSRVEPMWQGEVILGGVAVPAVGVDLDGVGADLFDVVQGRPPRPGQSQAAVTRPVMDRLDADVGSMVDTQEGPLQVVGEVRDPLQLDRQAAVVPPDQLAGTPSGFLVDLPADGEEVTARIAADLRRSGWDVTTRADLTPPSSGLLFVIITLGGIGLLVTALVTAAAFAVAGQRRQRELALLAAGGAEPRHLRRSVQVQAVVLGVAGALTGLLVGLALAGAALPWLEGLSNQAIEGLRISPAVLVAGPLTGLVTAVVAAWLSARSAARTPVAAALTGRRPPRTSSGRLLAAGVASTLAGLGVTVWTTTAAAASEAATTLGILVSTALVMIGLGATSPWLVERLAQVFGHRMPVGVRLALRDTARFRSRTAPVVIAIVAGLGLSIAAATMVDLMGRGLVAEYRPQLAGDHLLVDGPAPVPLVQQLQKALPVRAAAPIRTVEPTQPDADGQPLEVTVADAALLRAVDAPPAAVEALAAGQVLVLQDDDGPPGPGDPIVQAKALAPADAYLVDVDLVPGAIPPIMVSAQTLSQVGTQSAPTITAWLLALDGPVDAGQLQQAKRLADTFGQRVAVETGPRRVDAGAVQTIAVVATGILSLIIVGIGLALIATETRRDEEILATVGATPRIRRDLAAARAGVLTLIGGILAVPAGMLPIWGLFTSANTSSPIGLEVPWPSVVGVVIVVPLVASAAAWIAPPHLAQGFSSYR